MGYQRLRWNRYEIESYLVHPAAIARYVEETVAVRVQQFQDAFVIRVQPFDFQLPDRKVGVACKRHDVIEREPTAPVGSRKTIDGKAPVKSAAVS